MSALGVDTSMMGADLERGGELRRYIFAVELTGTIGTKAEEKGAEASNVYTWNPENASSMYKKIPVGNEEFEAIRQTLVVRRVVLGPSAKEGEANWLNIEVTDPEGADTKFPLACLIKGKEHQNMVDMVFPDARDVRVKFTLEEGTGPVHVIGYHLIERFQYESQDDDECEEDDVDEEEQVDDYGVAAAEGAEQPAKVQTLRAKRRINGAENGNGDAANTKKIKTDGNDEAMEEEAAATNGNAKK